jgi:CubicO group peptidase (beta-lactamase class C family)
MTSRKLMQGIPVPPEARIPRQDWDRAPWNRWSFHNIREILPTREVWRGPGPAWALPTRLQDLDEVCFELKGGTRTTLADWLDEDYTDGFIVVHHGEIVCERYFNTMTARSLHLSQSVAKSVTSAVAGILVGRGMLDPDQPVTDYLPELKRTAWKGATLRHVLDMTTGVRFVEDYEALDSDIAMTDIATGWKPARGRSKGPASVWDQILSLKNQVRPHGATFEYRSIETDVLAYCMQRVSGTDLADLVSRELWQPMGAEESACFTIDAAGYPLADGGFNATLRDYARFGLVMASGGIGNGRKIVPCEWIADTLDCNADIFGAPYTDTLPDGAYRNQFWVRDHRKRVLMARGVFGQLIYISPADSLVVVKLSSWPEFLSAERSINAHAAIDAIVQTLGS